MFFSFDLYVLYATAENPKVCHLFFMLGIRNNLLHWMSIVKYHTSRGNTLSMFVYNKEVQATIRFQIRHQNKEKVSETLTSK